MNIERENTSKILTLASDNFVIAKHLSDFKSKSKIRHPGSWTECLERIVIDLERENQKLVFNLVDRKISTKKHKIETNVPGIHIRRGVIVERAPNMFQRTINKLKNRYH